MNKIEKDILLFATLSLLGSYLIILVPLFLDKTEEGSEKKRSIFPTLCLLGTTLLYLGLSLGDNVGNNSNIVMAKGKKKDQDVIPVKIKNSVILDAPIIKQFPELPRGCEVTSLAMLLQYGGIMVGKMELAELIVKNPTPLSKKDGLIFWGHPNDGYIGNMYTYNQPGYGVYHKPIKELAEKFLPGRIIDLTGSNFEELKYYLSMDIPVWVITNTTYRNLPESYFQTWQTPSGEVKITYKEHSVLITGYDENHIYFNDPINGEKNKKILTADFMEAWMQMGSQAISYLPKDLTLTQDETLNAN